MASINKISVNGTEYDILADELASIVSVSDTQPTEESNKIWIKDDAEEIAVPTMDEFNAVKSDLTQITEPSPNLVSGWIQNAVVLSGDSAVIAQNVGTTVIFPCVSGKTYTFSSNAGSINRYMWAFFSDYPALNSVASSYSNTSADTITAPITGYGVRYILNSSSQTLVDGVQIEEGTVATPFIKSGEIAVDPIARRELANIEEHTRNILEGEFNAIIVITENNKAKFSVGTGETFYFPCESGKSYTFQTKGTVNRYVWAFYPDMPVANDETENYIVVSNANLQEAFTITAPVTGYCLRYVKNTNDNTLFSVSQVQEGEAQRAFVPSKITSVDIEARADIDAIRNPSEYKKILTIGDSLTNARGDGLSDGNRWQNQVTKILGLDGWVTGGTSGATVANINTSSIYAAVQSMILTADVDMVTFWGGTNDYANGVTIGDFATQLDSDTRDVTTYYGALCSCVEKILSIYPSKRIVLIGTTPRINDVSGNKTYHNNPNGLGLYLSDYVDAVETVAKYYGLPFLDLLRSGGINELNIDQYMFLQASGSVNIYLHFSNQGETLIGNRIGAFLKSLG